MWVNSKNKNKTVNSIIFLSVFLLSVIVRYDNLSKPLGRHHEYITAHVLCTDYRFFKDGASKFHFSPIMNFDSEAERKLSIYHLLRDKDNNFYYYSYPPFAFLFPHIVFYITQQEPSVLGIRIINLIIHFTCALLVYLIILKFFKKTIRDPVFMPAVIGYVIYFFASGNLWYHGNIYFADTLVQPFVLGLMYMMLKIFEPGSILNLKHYIILFALTFLGVYTEYLALFFSFVACAFLLFAFLKQKRKLYLGIVGIVSLATLSSLCLILVQYSAIADYKYLKNALINRYSMRSGHHDIAQGGFTAKDSISYDMISENYETSYAFLFDYAWIVLLGLTLCMIVKRKEIIPFLREGTLSVFFITGLAYLMHMLVFFNFNVIHDFGTLKSTLVTVPFIGFGLGIFNMLISNFSLLIKRCFYGLSILGTILFVHLSLNRYYVINDYSIRGEFVTELPELVKKYGDPDVFLAANTYFTFETCFYSKRRVESVLNINELLTVIRYCNIKEGVFFERAKDHYNILKVNQKGDTLLYATEPIK